MNIKNIFRKRRKVSETSVPNINIGKVTFDHYSLVSYGIIEFNTYCIASDMIVVYYDENHIETGQFVYKENVDNVMNIVKGLQNDKVILMIQDEETNRFSIVYDKSNIIACLYSAKYM